MTYQNPTYCQNLSVAFSHNTFFGETQKNENSRNLRLDYYPFGSPMYGRSFNSNSYKFGFQGQEAENELYGEGNASFYKYRISDNRLGRFFSVDPLAPKYPHNSPYAFSENRVIDAIELEGLEKYIKRWVEGVEGPIGTVTWESLNPGEEHGPRGTGVYNEIYRRNNEGELEFQNDRYNPSWRDLWSNNTFKESKEIVINFAVSEMTERIVKEYTTLSAFTAGFLVNTMFFVLSPYKAQAPGNNDFSFKQYHVIAGSFENEENAINFAEKMGGNVLPITENGLYRVSIFRSGDKETANYIKEQQAEKSIETWVYEEDLSVQTE